MFHQKTDVAAGTLPSVAAAPNDVVVAPAAVNALLGIVVVAAALLSIDASAPSQGSYLFFLGFL